MQVNWLPKFTEYFCCHKIAQASLRASFSCLVRVRVNLIKESEGSCLFKLECTLGEGHLMQSSTWPSPEPFPQAADRVANAVQEQLYGWLPLCT